MAGKDSKPVGKKPKASRGKSVKLTLAVRTSLYAARRLIPRDVQDVLRLRIPFEVYFRDPLVAKTKPQLGFDKNFRVPWEPGLADGPTSARFAVVDYDGTANTLASPARWDRKNNAFLGPNGEVLTEEHKETPQFHQVSVWATVQHTLDYFESGFGLGRRILWGFQGNRLIVVPHAGYGENAYYDRQSKSLQFYYFDHDGGRVQTCLSSDIVNHEFGHAVLDGIRPYFMEAISPETAAFHEFLGDLTALLMAFRNNAFRRFIGAETGGDLSSDTTLSHIAEQFGDAVSGQPYLRSAKNTLTMKDVENDHRPHYMSQVLTGAMFDIILKLSQSYLEKNERRRANDECAISVGDAFWYTVQRMQMMAIQPLDLLPPVDVTFRDYALAVLRAEEVANPTDPDGYRAMMIEVFLERQILDAVDRDSLLAPHHVFERLDLDVFHDIDVLGSSRAEAYRFLDDNRAKLFIPAIADVVIADVFIAQKYTREARRLPKQVLLQYVWREEITLDGERFGRFSGQTTSLLCGGTLALDQNGNMLAWARKPGTQTQLTAHGTKAERVQAEGKKRRELFLDALARRIKTGAIGDDIGGEKGLLANRTPPLTSCVLNGAVRFELSPHLGIHDDVRDIAGSRQWQISS
jgi:hypothetical protein